MIQCTYKVSIYFDEIKKVLVTIFWVAVMLAIYGYFTEVKISESPGYFYTTLVLISFVVAQNIPLLIQKRNAPRVVELHDHCAVFIKDEDRLSISYKDAEAVKNENGVISVYSTNILLRVYPSIRHYDLILKKMNVPEPPTDKRKMSGWWDKELFPWKGDKSGDPSGKGKLS